MDLFYFKNDHPFLKHQAQKVTVPQFTWTSVNAPVKIETESK